MDEDVKINESVEQTVEAPTEQVTQPVETPDTSNVQTPQQPADVKVERQVPLSELLAERKRRQEREREIAKYRAESQNSKYDPADLETVMQIPFVQDLILKDARRELTDHTKDLLDQYPTIPSIVKKAILKNVRGWVNEDTSDVETAKLDIQQRIEEIALETAEVQAPAPKGFPVVKTNVPATENSTASLAEVQKILDKPMDEMSKEDLDQLKEAHTKLKQ